MHCQAESLKPSQRRGCVTSMGLHGHFNWSKCKRGLQLLQYSPHSQGPTVLLFYSEYGMAELLGFRISVSGALAFCLYPLCLLLPS